MIFILKSSAENSKISTVWRKSNIIPGSLIVTLFFLEFYLLFNNSNQGCALKNLQSAKEKDVSEMKILTVDMIIIVLLNLLIILEFRKKTMKFQIILLLMILEIIALTKLLFFYFKKKVFMNNPTYSISLLVLTGSILFSLNNNSYFAILVIMGSILLIFHGYFSFFNRSYWSKINNFLSIPFFSFDYFKLKENMDGDQLRNYSNLLGKTKNNIYEISFYLSIFNGKDYDQQNKDVKMELQQEYWNFKVFILLDILVLIINFFYKIKSVKLLLINILLSGCAIFFYCIYNYCFSMESKLDTYFYLYLIFSIFVFYKFLLLFSFLLSYKISKTMARFFSFILAFITYKIFFISLRSANAPIYKGKKIIPLENTFNIYSIFTTCIIFISLVISMFSNYFYGFIVLFIVVLFGNFVWAYS